DARNHREQPIHELLTRHLEAQEDNECPLCGHVQSHRKFEARLAHSGPACDDVEVAGLEQIDHRVDVAQPGGNSPCWRFPASLRAYLLHAAWYDRAECLRSLTM